MSALLSAAKAALEMLKSAYVATDLVWKRHDLCESLSTAIQSAEAEQSEMEKDAARYRYLREGDNDELLLRFSLEASCTRDDVWLLRLQELDAAIDAAMKGTNHE